MFKQMPIITKKPNEEEMSKNRQKKRRVEEQDIGQPSAKSKNVNKFVNREDSDQEEEERDNANEIQNEPAVQKEEAESEVQTTNKTREEEIAQTEEPTSESPRIPAKEPVKWEKRCSERVTKMPNCWGNNVMISKIEKESTEGEEESLPSVIEIKTTEKRRKLLKTHLTKTMFV